MPGSGAPVAACGSSGHWQLLLANQRESHYDPIRYRAVLSCISADPAPSKMVGRLDHRARPRRRPGAVTYHAQAVRGHRAAAGAVVGQRERAQRGAAAAGHPDGRTDRTPAGHQRSGSAGRPRPAEDHASGVGLAGRPDERHGHHGHERGAVPGVPGREPLRDSLCAVPPGGGEPQPGVGRGAVAVADLLALQAAQVLPGRYDLTVGLCAAQSGGRTEGTAGPDAGQRRGPNGRRGAGHARADSDVAEFAQTRPGRPARPNRRVRAGPRGGLPAGQPRRQADLQGGDRAGGGRSSAGHDPGSDVLAAAEAGGRVGLRADIPDRGVIPVAADLAAVRTAGAAASQRAGHQPRCQ